MPETQPKLTPDKLTRLRQKMPDDAIVKYYSKYDSSFASRYQEAQKKGVRYKDKTGNEIPLSTASLNELVNGGVDLSSPADVTPEKGFFSRLGDSFKSSGERLARGFGSDQVREGRTETSKGFDLADLPGDIADVVGPSLPLIGSLAGGAAGGIVTAPTGPGAVLGAAAGAGAGASAMEGGRQMVGDLFKVNEKYGDPTAAPISLGKVAKEGAIGAVSEVGGRVISQGAKVLKPAFIKAGAKMTNLADDVLERAWNHPNMMSDAITKVSKNVKEPFLNLADDISKKMIALREEAKKKFIKGKDIFKEAYPDASFDFSQSLDEVNAALKEFNLTGVKPPLNPAGKAILKKGTAPKGVVLSQGQAEPLVKKEVDLLQQVITKLTEAKKYSVDDGIDLRKFFGRMYDEVELSNTGGPKLYHKILTRLKGIADEKIMKAMPTELKDAYKAYAQSAIMQDTFGRKFIQKVGNKKLTSDQASTFLKSLAGKNRGERRRIVQELEEHLGMDITNQVQFIEDAQKLMQLFPETGPRTADIIRSFLVRGAASAAPVIGGLQTGVNGAILGGIGAAGMMAATSPVVVGKGAMLGGRLAQSAGGKALTKLLEKAAPAEKAAIFELLNSITN